MDYTPISMRRVLLAFAFTAFVALLPALYFVLQSGSSGPFSRFADAGGPPQGLILGAGSVVLTGALVGVVVAAVAIGRRMIRRPSRA